MIVLAMLMTIVNYDEDNNDDAASVCAVYMWYNMCVHALAPKKSFLAAPFK